MVQRLRQRFLRLLTKRYFYKLIGLGLLSAVVPIIIISFSSYKITVTHLNEQKDHSRLDVLGQLQSRVDERLETAKQALYAMVFDPDVAEAIHMNPSMMKAQLLIDVQHKLAILDQSISESYGVSLYFVRNKSVLFHDRYIKESDMDWMADFPKYGKAGEWVYQEGNGFQVITHTIALPAISTEPTAYLSIHLRRQAFDDILDDIDFIDEADLHVLDAGHQPIISRITHQIDEARMHRAFQWIKQSPLAYQTWKNTEDDLSVQYVKSDKTGWSTVLLVPLSVESGFTSQIVWLTVLISLLAVAAGILLTYVSSRRLYAPIQNWLQDENFSSEDHQSDEWTLLRSKWVSLKEDLKKNEPKLKEAFLISWLGGTHIKSKAEIEAKLRQHQIPADRKCAVFIADPGNFAEHSSFKADDEMLVHLSMTNIFNDLLAQNYLDGDALRRPETYHTIFIVYFEEHMTAEQAEQILKQLAHNLAMSVRTYLKFPVTAALGGVKSSVFELRDSYVEAKETMQYRIIREDESILETKRVRKEEDRFQYPFDLSEQIVKELRSGDQDGLENSFSQFVESVSSKYYSDQVYRQIYLMLYDATLQAFYQHSKEAVSDLLHLNGHEKILSAQFLTEIERWFQEEWFPHCLDIIEKENEGRGKKVIETVKKYITSSLQNDHSLQEAAEHVNLNPSYLSRLFLKETGQNFLQYVAEIKIEEAKRLLEHTDEPIYKIAEAVGYTEQTFRRVFKNLTKMSPNEYRMSLRR